MQFILTAGPEAGQHEHVVFLVKDANALDPGTFSKEEIRFMASRKKEFREEFFAFNRIARWTLVRFIKDEKDSLKRREECRKAGDQAARFLNDHNLSAVLVDGRGAESFEVAAFAEGMALGNYQFNKYRKDAEKKNKLAKILIRKGSVTAKEFNELGIVAKAVYRCRDLVNEPYSYLTATVFAGEIASMGRKAGAVVEVMNRKKIEALKMGGLLGVNQGSNDPPVFTVMEWKPQKPKNKKPYVFIGKGIVFDSGGMNLKPGDSMTTMKCDMSGAAAVACAITAVAEAGLPLHVIGLIPATDNRPGPRALVPGDVIRMYNKMTVEVLNTDAEGRLILADALSYAKKYDPQLVIDLATLTGSAARAIGRFGIVAMEYNAEKELRELKRSGWEVYERLVEFPNWDEYGELMKSDVADLKNLGPAEGGAITAGKFLEKFADFPYIHLDIAGPAFLEKRDSYRGQGGTGVGVRLLFDFVKRIAE